MKILSEDLNASRGRGSRSDDRFQVRDDAMPAWEGSSASNIAERGIARLSGAKALVPARG